MTLRRTISVVLPDLRGGGAESLHIALAREWLSLGLSVDFLLLRREGELLRMVPQEARVISLGARRFRNALLPLRAYLERERPDVLLAAMWPLTVVATLAARLSKSDTRVAISDHEMLSCAYSGKGGLHGWLMRWSMKMAYPLADARIGVSRGVVHDLSRLSGLPEERFRVIYNPAAHGRVAAPVHLEGIKGPLILSVGKFKEVKDHMLLIDAFARLSRDREATLCILGDGDLRPALERRIAEHGLGGRVLLPGFQLDTAPWYARADLFVLSSRHEGFGNVIVEALEQGTPVVSTDCPSGPREILQDGRCGRLVPVGDVEALAQAMEEALRETPDRKMLMRRARDFRADQIARQYLNVMFDGWPPGEKSG